MLPLRGVPVYRTVTQHDGTGGWIEREVLASRIDCRISDPYLAGADADRQQGRVGTDLRRDLHTRPNVDLRPGDVVRVTGLRLRVDSLGGQSDGIYTKALVIEDAPE